MTNNNFLEFVKARLNHQQDTLTNKGVEYSKSDNRFHNFDISKKLYELIERKDTDYFVYYANFCKQFTGIIDILNGKDYDENLLNEKFGDCANYLLLLQAKLMFDKSEQVK